MLPLVLPECIRYTLVQQHSCTANCCSAGPTAAAALGQIALLPIQSPASCAALLSLAGRQLLDNQPGNSDHHGARDLGNSGKKRLPNGNVIEPGSGEWALA